MPDMPVINAWCLGMVRNADKTPAQRFHGHRGSVKMQRNLSWVDSCAYPEAGSRNVSGKLNRPMIIIQYLNGISSATPSKNRAHLLSSPPFIGHVAGSFSGGVVQPCSNASFVAGRTLVLRSS